MISAACCISLGDELSSEHYYLIDFLIEASFLKSNMNMIMIKKRTSEIFKMDFLRAMRTVVGDNILVQNSPSVNAAHAASTTTVNTKPTSNFWHGSASLYQGVTNSNSVSGQRFCYNDKSMARQPSSSGTQL